MAKRVVWTGAPLLLWVAVNEVAGQDLFLASSLGVVEDDARTVQPKSPNIVWFLTDDQDQMLYGSFPPTAPGGATPMPKTKKLMQDEGIHATKWYIHTPICSPSRAELLTGRYFHNIKGVGGNSGGMHVNYSKVYDHSFMRTLKEQGGYATGLFGKYLNVMPKTAPQGFDAWLANFGGDYIAPKFWTKGIDGLPDGTFQFSNDPGNYTTAVVGNTSIAWIKKVAKQGKPFIAYIAPKAAHEPFNPAPWYRDHWDPSWPDQEPRSENWNCSAASRKDHHGNIASEQMITPEAAYVTRGVFRNRWRTLMSVDDVIAEVIRTVDELGLSDSTYFLYSSDHGFQLGQFNIPMDKRHVYEWDTKIHLLARGPGIGHGTSFDQPGTQVDIAPTLLGLAGVQSLDVLDGRSIVPFLLHESKCTDVLPATREHLSHLGVDVCGGAAAYASTWRDEIFIEYYFNDPNVKCMMHCQGGNYPQQDSACVDLHNNSACWCAGLPDAPNCYATESLANNFIALRRLADGDDTLYAEFQSGNMAIADVDFSKVDYTELYDIPTDTWHLNNLATDPATGQRRATLSARLHQWFQCSGSSCP